MEDEGDEYEWEHDFPQERMLKEKHEKDRVLWDFLSRWFDGLDCRENEEKTATYVNGLKLSIRREVCFEKVHTMEEAYQFSLAAKKKLIKRMHEERRVSAERMYGEESIVKYKMESVASSAVSRRITQEGIRG